WDISFDVKQGEILTIVGANGAGKTTILKAVVGLVERRGRVEFDGEDISHLPGHRMAELGISYVPEGRQVFPEMTVLENLIVGSYNRRAKPYREETLAYVLDTFPSLKDRLKNLGGSLSGGEQQM